ncbi:SDR family NAD(P)-dependent oxidoreductase [Kushneria aurantia]|uniref:SDR family NAD(P)-dependent oxidoreductase n=1 Tax=Kushneria aurantia TaxID=504092 RepID=A0ABV6G501_9GAMM|nr:SDR family NAD(P)-dependent oxidoreductase [Kushneria aurantia]
MSDSRQPTRCLLITGATGAIGGALAREWAAAGIRLHLHGRQQAPLQALAEECRAKGAEVMTHSDKLTDEASLFAWLDRLCEEDLPDIVIAAAGVNIHPDPEKGMEHWEAASGLIDLNIRAPMAMLNRMAAAMIERGSGQFVLLSSLAGWFGLPLTPSYSASKAAIKTYGEAMRGLLAARGVGVSVVMPGYVSSRMCDAMPGHKPFLWTPQRAARRIRRGIEGNRARISFPFPLDFGCWWLAVLPAAVSQRLVQMLGFGAPEQ